MIKHIVMWRVRGANQNERAVASQRVKIAFEGLRGQIAGMHALEVGIDKSAVDYACHVVLVTEFCSQAALDRYASDPNHLRVREELADLRTERYQVDYTVA